MNFCGIKRRARSTIKFAELLLFAGMTCNFLNFVHFHLVVSLFPFHFGSPGPFERPIATFAFAAVEMSTRRRLMSVMATESQLDFSC